MKLRELPLIEIVLALIVLAAGHLVAIGLNGEPLFSHWYGGAAHYQILFLLLVILVFIVVSAILVKWARERLRLSNLSVEECEPKKVVIAFLSTSNATVERKDGKFTVTQRANGEDKSVELDGQDLDADIGKLNSIRWNWQQLLRSLKRHTVNEDGHVFLIGSKPTKSDDPQSGSQGQFDKAEKLIQMYFKNVTINKTDTPVNFEDFKELVKCIGGIIKRYKKLKFKEDDMLIDVTGGQKTASITGAIMTLNTRVQFHYISTIDPTECVAYDISYRPPPKPE